MDKNETIKILALCKAGYPNQYKGMKTTDAEALINLWNMQFCDISYQDVELAVMQYISSDTTGYMATVGKLKEIIAKNASKQLDEYEAWRLVSNACKWSGYHAKEEFNKLPPTIQKMLGTPQRLKDYGKQDLTELETVTASNFMRAYKARLIEQNNNAMLPNKAKAQIKEQRANKIENCEKKFLTTHKI